MEGSKNSGERWRNGTAFAALLAVVVSLFGPRVALSVSMTAFVAATLAHNGFLSQVRRCFANRMTAFFTLLFFIPFVSGLWSGDVDKWSDVVRIKLPLLLFPVAFAGRWRLSPKQWYGIAAAFLAMIFGGCFWSVAQYLPNAAAVHESYLKAKSIPVPLENDHVRFSWLVAVAVILCGWLLHTVATARWRWALSALLLFFVAYLHVLSARTGLLSLYGSLALYAVWQVARNRKRRWAFVAPVAIVALPLLAYAALPTLRARVGYMVYDASFVRKGEYLPGSNDGARTMSLKVGWRLLAQNPLGIGAGDVMHEAEKWYRHNVPQALPADKFYPSSEWLMYGAFAGWPGVVLFTVVMALPFFARPLRGNPFWLALNATAAFSFLFDMGLEVQYGVAAYATVFFCAWKAGNGLVEKTNTPNP